jgi:hypothetical protein
VDCHDGCWGYERGHVVAVRADHDWGSEAPCMCGIICLSQPPDPTLLAGCEGDRCAVHDLRLLGMTACSTDADCAFVAQACCPPSTQVLGSDEIIAVGAAHAGSVHDLICDGTPCGEPPTIEVPLAPRCSSGECRIGTTTR